MGSSPRDSYCPPHRVPGVAKFHTTILFHNEKDPVVRVAENSEPLADAAEIRRGLISTTPSVRTPWYKDNEIKGPSQPPAPGATPTKTRVPGPRPGSLDTCPRREGLDSQRPGSLRGRTFFGG